MLSFPVTKRFCSVEGESFCPGLSWLTYEQSLTDRLLLKAGEATLEVLHQGWERSDWWDRHVLTLKHEPVFRREILMSAHDAPCWYARTTIPKTTYDTDHLFFNRLETESLGALIFNSSKIKRRTMIHYPISAKSLEYYWISPWIDHLRQISWVRLSILSIDNQYPFCLIEILLPGLERYFD